MNTTTKTQTVTFTDKQMESLAILMNKLEGKFANEITAEKLTAAIKECDALLNKMDAAKF